MDYIPQLTFAVWLLRNLSLWFYLYTNTDIDLKIKVTDLFTDWLIYPLTLRPSEVKFCTEVPIAKYARNIQLRKNLLQRVKYGMKICMGKFSGLFNKNKKHIFQRFRKIIRDPLTGWVWSIIIDFFHINCMVRKTRQFTESEPRKLFFLL